RGLRGTAGPEAALSRQTGRSAPLAARSGALGSAVGMLVEPEKEGSDETVPPTPVYRSGQVGAPDARHDREPGSRLDACVLAPAALERASPGRHQAVVTAKLTAPREQQPARAKARPASGRRRLRSTVPPR